MLVPELKEKEINIKTIKESDTIIIRVEVDNESIEMEYKNIRDILEWQKFVMAKVALLKLKGKKYKWGGIIGVRPTKIVRKFLREGADYEKIKDILINLYLVDKDKVELLITVVKKELEYLNNEFINIYIGIPYCPTKCRYCSFASYEKKGEYKRRYVDFLDHLKEEIKIVGESLKKLNKKVESIYIGGGTPTILNSIDLKDLLITVKETFSFEYLKEFTLEAGRIDTIDSEKLVIAKELGVNRISINPQSFNEKTLKLVNRYWDQEKFDEIYNEAKRLDFIINMDLIFGLPNENTDDILFTLNKTKDYNIDNLTIHMLAVKRASNLRKENYEIEAPDYEKVYKKLDEVLEIKKMKPYYMYRQKNSIEWGENTGFAVEGTESIFNIAMIEEYQDTIAFGGGGITKLIYEDKIERLANPKDPLVYLNEYKERIEKKIKTIKEKYI